VLRHSGLLNNPDGAAFPHCEISALKSQCVTKCTTAITPFSCTATDTLHVCTQAADCATDGTNNSCCPVYGYMVCLNSTVATAGGITGCLN